MSTDSFIPDRLRIPKTFRLRQEKLPRPQAGEHFLKGPIPLGWLLKAGKLPGKSLHVGIAMWYAAGLTNSRTLRLSNIAVSRFGIDRNAKYRALSWLERAGLIAVDRNDGRSPTVTILPAQIDQDVQS